MYHLGQVTLAKLIERTNQKGETVFVGKLGVCDVLLVRSKDVTERGRPIWHMRLSEPTERVDTRQPKRRDPPSPKPPIALPETIEI